ncbi:Glycosyltransferase involved in cell wall bisynthesis [Chryseobacterium arachidis]|uniref:Glycosyltransferase involved in cell wall bisynthesis n=1 Tax=Chryseobacterium arachidis TaxID=1416778 RepID=A0A1M5D6N4_9FLAO|nr:glycosyltransferase family A protein [Chryseobacterium arachidis]SHF62525.1 Glycosyltransferase involved in cell wall bisynthesis [Chryseobacterium arachidis]
MKKFSILIANYNNGKYFKECYESIISQTYSNWEVIIVDDRSTDDSVEVIKEIITDDPRFKLYENETNKGCGFTKRKCMEFAEGDLCGYVDPDDALYPEALEKSVAEYDYAPEIVATYSRMMMCNEDLIPDKTFPKTKEIYNDKYFFNCPVQFAHFFTFRKDIYLQTQGINSELTSAVDQDLYLKILDHGNPSFIDEDLYLYRLHAKGISQFKSKKNAKNSFAKVIHETMKRRDLKTIDNIEVPDFYTDSAEIFKLLNYQTRLFYRIKNRARLAFKRR